MGRPRNPDFIYTQCPICGPKSRIGVTAESYALGAPYCSGDPERQHPRPVKQQEVK